MNRIVLNLALAFLLAASALAQSPPKLLWLQCVIPGLSPEQKGVTVDPRSAEEAARLHQAPHGARRVTRHRLEVGWAGGKRVFKDKPPFEPLAGVHWAYCGFGPELKLHLLRKEDGDLFTGVLLDDKNGSVLPAGEAVLFSPDRQFYLAYEQQDGLDGETLKLYRRNGNLIGEGLNDVLSADGNSILAHSENIRDMRWDSQNRPQATVVLSGGRKQTITLTEVSPGKQEWLPRIQE